jgi:hypothetical protein
LLLAAFPMINVLEQVNDIMLELAYYAKLAVVLPDFIVQDIEKQLEVAMSV